MPRNAIIDGRPRAAIDLAPRSTSGISGNPAKDRPSTAGTTTALVHGQFGNETLRFGTAAEQDSPSWLVFTNVVTIVLNLGLGTPVVLHRIASFMARTTCMAGALEAGALDAEGLAQDTLAPSGLGQGYLQSLDPGID